MLLLPELSLVFCGSVSCKFKIPTCPLLRPLLSGSSAMNLRNQDSLLSSAHFQQPWYSGTARHILSSSVHSAATWVISHSLCSFKMARPGNSGPWPLIQFLNNISQTVKLLGRVISPSKGRYLNTGQHKQYKDIHTPNIHALSGIRNHNPSVRAREESSCLRLRGYCNRLQPMHRVTNSLPEPP
jgi:hypothetical protein